MPSMFNKDTPKSCAWCKFSKVSEFNNDILCIKHGITAKHEVCNKYKYDVLKRIPQIKTKESCYTADDFKL